MSSISVHGQLFETSVDLVEVVFFRGNRREALGDAIPALQHPFVLEAIEWV
jgi:hypothetical protein